MKRVIVVYRFCILTSALLPYDKQKSLEIFVEFDFLLVLAHLLVFSQLNLVFTGMVSHMFIHMQFYTT